MSLFAANDDKPLPCSTSFIEEPPSLFGDDRPQSDYAFAKTALQQLSIPDPIAQFSVDDLLQTVTLTAPADLQDRLKLGMPAEARDKGHRYTLTASNLAMAEAIERARQAKREEESWPALHYLWPQHPIMEWLTERVLTAFGRHRAPVIRLPHLAEGEQAFILLSLIPNRKGQPLLIEWRVAVQREGKWELEAFPDFAARTGLQAGKLPNSGQTIDTSALQKNLPAAVTAMRKFMVERQKTFAANMDARLENTLADLARLQGKQLEQLEWNFAKSQLAENLKRGQREQRTQHIRKVFDEYRDWVRDTMTTEPEPFIQVLAAAIL
jgi:hypothetical protein